MPVSSTVLAAKTEENSSEETFSLNFASNSRLFSPTYSPPPEKVHSTSLATLSISFLTEVEALIPNWAVKWGTSTTTNKFVVWIEPRGNVAIESEVRNLLKKVQDLAYPLPVRIEFPPGVQNEEGKGIPRVFSYLQNGRQEGKRESVKKPEIVRATDPNQEKLRREIESALEHLVKTSRISFFKLSLEEGPMHFVVLSLWPVPGKEAEIDSWRDGFQKKYGYNVLISKRESSAKIEAELTKIADSDGMLRPEHLPALRDYRRALFGKPPPCEIISPEVQLTRKDMTFVPFIAMDEKKTKDREDLIFAEITRHGELRVLVAYVDITDLISRDSPMYWYAKQVGSNIYGSKHVVSTLPRKISHNLASFKLNEVRPAWVVEFRIDRETGELKPQGPDSVQAAYVKTHQYMTPHQFSCWYLNTPEGKNNRATAIVEAGSHLRKLRLQKNKIVRLDGDNVGSNALGELMIAAAGTVGDYMAKSGFPVIWRVHAKLSDASKAQLAEEIRDVLKRPVPVSEFSFGRKFAPLIHELEKKGTRQANDLIRRLVTYFQTKSRFSVHNEGHFGVARPNYLSLKGRDASAIPNQLQLRAIKVGQGRIPFKEIKQDAEQRDRLKANEDERMDRFRNLEMLEKRLAWKNKIFEASVTSYVNGELRCKVPGFKFDGVVDTSLVRDIDIKWQVGQRTIVRLKGYQVSQQTFHFEVVRVPVMSGLEALESVANRESGKLDELKVPPSDHEV